MRGHFQLGNPNTAIWKSHFLLQCHLAAHFGTILTSVEKIAMKVMALHINFFELTRKNILTFLTSYSDN